MENIEENQVTAGAAKADPMPASGVPVEDLGGPTPENYKPDDDSAKLKDPAATLAQVKDIVNAKAAKAEEAEPEGDVIEEEPKQKQLMKLLLKKKLLKRKLLQKQKKLLKKKSSKRKRQLTSKQMYKALLEGEELSEEFQTKQELSLRVQSVLRLQQSKKICKKLCSSTS